MRSLSRLFFAVLAFWPLAGCRTTSGARTPTYLIRVERGDTLASIAAKYDTSWDKIAKLNGLSAGEAPRLGSVIRVQPGPGGLVADAGGGSSGSGSGGRRGRAAKLPAAVKRPGNADPSDEFQESDFPDVERASADGGSHHGLFFSGGDGGGGAGLQWPLIGELSSGYGMRHGRFHHGVDIRAKKGTTVLAAGPGVVEFAGRQNGYGKVIIIRHASLKTVYAHLDDINVNVGDKVDHATEIGATGLSGNSTGPHLHFEIRNLKDQSIDPLSIMEKNKLLTARR